MHSHFKFRVFLVVPFICLSLADLSYSTADMRLRIFYKQNFLKNQQPNEQRDIENRKKREISSEMSYLYKYGYASPDAMKTNEDVRELQSVTKAIIEMQRFLGLPQTGKFDKATKEMIRRPRCANPDRTSVMGDLVRKKRYTTVGSKWKKLRITYSINNYTPKIGKSGTHTAIVAAFSVWAKHAPLDFVKVSKDDNPDIVILFAKGYHDDNTAFDGAGGYLAHAYYPGPGIGGDTHFDAEEPWTINKGPYEGNDLFLVAVHELGHALGLGHSPDTKAIMAPVYQYHDTANFQLPKDDIDGIQMLYGVRAFVPQRPIETSTSTDETATTTLPSKTKHTTQSQTRASTRTAVIGTTQTAPPPPEICHLDKIDAVSFLRNEFYVFSSQYLWRKGANDKKPRGPYAIASFWPQVGSGVDAVFEKPVSGTIVMIKGDKYYEFDGTDLLRGFPRDIRHMGIHAEKFDAGIWWDRNGKIYLFEGDHYWRMSKDTAEKDYPRDISAWKGVPEDIDSAFIGLHDDGLNHTYFVKGNRYWKFHNRKVEVIEKDGNFAKDWLNCEVTVAKSPSPPSGVSSPVIITVTIFILIIIIALTIYIKLQRRKSGYKYPPSDSRHDPAPAYRGGYKTHIGEETDSNGPQLWVKTFQHEWNNIKFSFQQKV